MKRLADSINYINPIEIVGEINNFNFSIICYDSRKAIENSAFVSIIGEKTDGHNYIENAYKQGCRIFFVQKIPVLTFNDAIYQKEVLNFLNCYTFER